MMLIVYIYYYKAREGIWGDVCFCGCENSYVHDVLYQGLIEILLSVFLNYILSYPFLSEKILAMLGLTRTIYL